MAAEPPEASCSRDAPPAASSSAAAAAGGGGGVGGPNPCCAKLWKKCQKLETSRTALREAVKLLQAESEKLQKENSELSKVCKEERLRGDSAEAARATESDARDLLEKELIELKTQNSVLQQSQNICKNDNELLRISELEEENRKLRQVLGEERKKITSEKKKAEEEKSKALETQKVLKSETQKSEEFRRVADTERKVANDWRASCERLRSEANEVRAQLAAQIRKTEEALKRVETEKQTVAREKKRADSEKSLSEKNKTLIEVERKKVSAEKSRADNLFAKLEEQKRLNEHLRTSIQVETKKAIDEKKRVDHLFQKLEEEKKQSEYLWRKTNELCSGRDAISSGNCERKHVDTASGGANVKLLKEKLKLKKEQLKHVKNVSKLDKAKNALIRRELQRLKQDWMQLLSRFNMLDDHLAGGVEGIHVLTELKQHPEIHGNFEQKLLPNDSVPAPYFGLQAGMVPFVSSIPREYASYQLPRESCTRPISGTSSELGPPLGSSHRAKSKSHRKPSYPTSISDEKFMGSQDKDSLLVSSSKDIRKKQTSVVPELPPNKNCEALKLPLSGCTKVTDKTLGGDRKRKRSKMSLEPTASQHGLLHSKPKDHATTSNDILATEDNTSGLQQANNTMLCVTEGDTEIHRREYLAACDKAPPFSFPSKGGNDCAGSKFASLLSFEEMIRENCLKLLNFDDDADEEKYRKAKERPLSPNLPIIRPHRTNLSTCEPHSLGDRALDYCPGSGSDSMRSKHSKESSIDSPLLEKVSTDPSLSTEFAEETFVGGNYASSAFSLAVRSRMETRWTILKGDQINVLISLIEDFILNKEVVVSEKMGQKGFGATKDNKLDDEGGIELSVKAAKVNQFIAACILLASICMEVDRVDVVLEVSYKVLQMAIRLVVLLLESKDTSMCLMSSYIQSNKPTTLPSCAHCLFDVDTVSVDGFISSLLDELDLCSQLWNNHGFSNETTRCSSHLGSTGLEINCGEPCSVFKQGKLAEDNDKHPERINLCYFTELISLFELFGIYMSCEWTYTNVAVRLLEILESCMCDEFAAALLVLVSQLGRFFVDDVGYEQRRVSEMRDKLSSLLGGTSFTKSRSLSVQFSAIGALLSVIPLPFDSIVATQSTQLSGPFAMSARQISEWFVHFDMIRTGVFMVSNMILDHSLALTVDTA
ncbi:hypothetical protein HU200_055154 [Digitaria exilis]|uniref:Maternal effect embryo arrest 22 n=1 Tax=Digitaria exilis TaxID=1010633 RepID=A0A835AL72_9POAL|nr:hypothetical protein HU200_055154 [Digitaria exilis]